MKPHRSHEESRNNVLTFLSFYRRCAIYISGRYIKAVYHFIISQLYTLNSKLTYCVATMDQNENIVSGQTGNVLHHQFKLLSAQIFFNMKEMMMVYCYQMMIRVVFEFMRYKKISWEFSGQTLSAPNKLY